MSSIKIVVDNRENQIFKKILKEIIEQFISVTFIKYRKIYKEISILDATLDVGDITISDDSNIILIERKTYSDLSSSIKDGRSHKQAANIKEKENYYRNNNIYVESYYLMEASKLRHGDLPENTIIQAMINKQFRDKFNIIHTSDMTDTSLYITGILKCVLQYGFKDNSRCGEKERIEIRRSKKSDISSFINMLTCIPRISYSIAKPIVDIYKYPARLVYELATNGENSLVGIKINESRNIGKGTSKKIYKHFMGQIT